MLVRRDILKKFYFYCDEELDGQDTHTICYEIQAENLEQAENIIDEKLAYTKSFGLMNYTTLDGKRLDSKKEKALEELGVAFFIELLDIIENRDIFSYKPSEKELDLYKIITGEYHEHDERGK